MHVVGYVEEDDYNNFDDVQQIQTRSMPPAMWALDRINQDTPQLDNDVSFSGKQSPAYAIWTLKRKRGLVLFADILKCLQT